MSFLEINYDEIRRIYRLEKSTLQLVEVEDDFYDSLNDFIAEQKEEYIKSLKDFSLAKARDFTNMKKMVEEIFSLREKKILNKALSTSRTGETSKQNMCAQEKKTFSELLKILEKHRALLNEIFESDGKKTSKKQSEDTVKVKVLKEVPSFVGGDMKEYGPFSAGQKVSLPNKIATLLKSRKLVEDAD